MKLTTILLLVTMFHVHAGSFAQTVTFSGRSVSLQRVFAAIKDQTRITFFYDKADLKDTRPVSLNVKNASLASVLEQIMEGQPLDYELQGTTVFISRKSVPAKPDADKLSDQSALPLSLPVRVRLRITNVNNQPLAGASITNKKTRHSIITDASGIANIEARVGDAFEISFIGYKRQTVTIGENSSALNIVMLPADSRLDEVQIIGYGTTSRRLATGSVVTVTSKDIENQPVMNPLLALQGQVPGLVVTPTTGYASGPVKMLVRGRANISPFVSSEPLILIDGMPITTMNLGNSDQTSGSNILPVLTQFQIANNPAGGESPLFGLNPRDIESITVLKDADATAIYGSRGANGVVLINTKRSRAGATRFSVNVNQGFSKVLRRADMMNTSQYVQMRKEALLNDGISLTKENAPDLMIWDTTRNIDWQDVLWGGTGKVTSMNVGVTGGNSTTSFRINGAFNQQTTILSVDGGSRAANVAVSLEHHTPNEKFSISLSSIYSSTFSDMISQSGLATSLPPNAPDIYDAHGNLNYTEWNAASDLDNTGNLVYPFASLLQPSESRKKALNGSVELKFRPVKAFTFSTRLGYNNTTNNSLSQTPIASQNPARNPTASALFTNTDANGWNVEPQAEYSNYIGTGRLSVLAGATYQSSTSRFIVNRGFNYPNDFLMGSIMNAPNQASYDGYGQYKYAGIYGRISYDLEHTYLLNLNGRRDGSSRFGPGNRYGNFGSVGVGWVVSNEKWFQRYVPAFINFFKLRGSYGVTGSDGVPDYQYTSQWASGTTTALYPGYGTVNRVLVNQHAVNQDFQWQSNRKLSEALEIGFLEDSRLALQIEHYRNRCGNQLLQYPTAIFTGFGSVTANWEATVQNSGWEFSLVASRIISSNGFTWSASANLSINRNKLYAYPGIENTTYYSRLLVGQSLNAVYLYRYLGVDPLTGRYTVEDVNHDGQISATSSSFPPLSPSSDLQLVKDLAPNFTGGVTMAFTYKGLSLNLLFDFVNQVGSNPFFGATNGLPGAAGANQPVELLADHWQKPGDIAKYSAFTTGSSSISAGSLWRSFSDVVYTDASFVRLNNVSFSYATPERIVKKMKLSGLSLFINAQNVLMFTRYKGVDPELQSFTTMPLAKVITGGISVNF